MVRFNAENGAIDKVKIKTNRKIIFNTTCANLIFQTIKHLFECRRKYR